MATARIAGLMLFAGVLPIALASEARAQVVVPHGGRVVVAPHAVRSAQPPTYTRPGVAQSNYNRVDKRPSPRPLASVHGNVRPLPYPTRPRYQGVTPVAGDQDADPADGGDNDDNGQTPPDSGPAPGDQGGNSVGPNGLAPGAGLRMGWRGGIIGNMYDLTVGPGGNGKLGAVLEWTNPSTGRKGNLRFEK